MIWGSGVAVDGSGNAVVAGDFQGTVNFGGGNIVSAGSYDIFVAKYGNPPGILHIADIPSDVGKVVGIHFMSSAHDVPGTGSARDAVSGLPLDRHARRPGMGVRGRDSRDAGR